MRAIAGIAVLLLSTSVAAQTPVPACLEELAALERPRGVILPPVTVDRIRRMAREAVAFADVGNEQACRVRVGQVASVLDSYVPDDSALAEHRVRLQTARPLTPEERLSVEAVEDKDLWAPTGEWLGEAEGVEAGFLLVERDGLFGIGGDVVPVPMDFLHVTEDEDLVLPVGETTFRLAPSFADEEDIAAKGETALAESARFWSALAER